MAGVNRRPPLFVVSLPGSPRRAAMARRLAQWPGEWSFVDGVDGMSLSREELAAVYDEARALRAGGRALSRPEIGCALSHRRIYEVIAGRGIGTAVVLEDDAAFGNELRDFPFWDLAAGFDVINLYTFSGLVRSRPHAQSGAVALHRAAGKVNSAVGYVVSLRGARKLLAATQSIHSVADWPIPPEHLQFYVAVPFPVQHPGRESVIEGERSRVRSGGRPGSRGALGRLADRYIGNITVPLFLRYLAHRGHYIDVKDYFRREIAYDVKRMLPMFYRSLGDA